MFLLFEGEGEQQFLLFDKSRVVGGSELQLSSGLIVTKSKTEGQGRIKPAVQRTSIILHTLDRRPLELIQANQPDRQVLFQQLVLVMLKNLIKEDLSLKHHRVCTYNRQSKLQQRHRRGGMLTFGTSKSKFTKCSWHLHQKLNSTITIFIQNVVVYLSRYQKPDRIEYIDGIECNSHPAPNVRPKTKCSRLRNEFFLGWGCWLPSFTYLSKGSL